MVKLRLMGISITKIVASVLIVMVISLSACGNGGSSDISSATKSSSNSSTLQIGSIGSLKAASPRHAGFMDENLAGSPLLAVKNLSDGSIGLITYDFRLYSNNDLTELIASQDDVSEGTSEDNVTIWYPSTLLEQDVTYFWVARAVVNGMARSWSETFDFTVTNLCGISNSSYAEYVINQSRTECSAINHQSASEVLGPPDAVGHEAPDTPYSGIFSLTGGGYIVVETSGVVINKSGVDIRVYEYVSMEPLEVFAGLTEVGPWYSMGITWCYDYCDFDLNYTGLSYAKYFKIKDRWSTAIQCHETSGVDIDSVQNLHGPTYLDECIL